MFRKIWVLALGLALVSAVSMAQEKNVEPSSINTYPNCAVPGNIINNCGFETGAFAPEWMQSGDPSFTAVANYAAHHAGVANLSNFGAYFGPTGSLGCISQTVPTPAFNYDISLWLTNFGQPNEFQLSWNGVVLSDWMQAGNLGWTQLSWNGVFTVPTPSTLQICFFNPPAYFYVDDIVVIATPGSPLKP